MALRLGERQKSCHDIAFLLVLAGEEATGDRKYGLSTVWVNPSQARVPFMEEVVGSLTAWISSGPNWPYTLVQLHKGTCHVPLPKEGHWGILPWRGSEVTPCGQIRQLEVCQLLITGRSHVICGLHPSSVDAPVDIHGRSCNFPFFHPRKALLVGCWVTALPLSSCGVLFFHLLQR